MQNLLGSQIANQQLGIQGLTAYGTPERWEPAYFREEGFGQQIPGILTGMLGGFGSLLTGIGAIK